MKPLIKFLKNIFVINVYLFITNALQPPLQHCTASPQLKPKETFPTLGKQGSVLLSNNMNIFRYLLLKNQVIN